MIRRSLLWVLFLLVAAMPLSAQVLEACINKGNGGMRLVDASTACLPNETRVQWNMTGPAGPAGPAGPPGADASNGPPYVWVCTPVNYKNAGSTLGTLYVFNGGSVTANVTAQWLSSAGVDLAGVIVPGAVAPNPGDPAPVYPGFNGTLGPNNTFSQEWYTAQFVNPASEVNTAIAIRISSDQPITASTNIIFSGFHAVPCSALHP